MSISTSEYGRMTDGYTITRYVINNTRGITLGLLNYGAIIESIHVPDRNGLATDITLGFDNLEDWVTRNTPYFGAVVGRCANRIGNGRFSIDGRQYQLAVNNGPNCLHGGLIGFDKKVWNTEIVESRVGQGVKFTLLSPDGDENFPGNLRTEVTYTLTDENEIRIDYRARTDAPTVVNLTNHTYFNLAGTGADTIGDHFIKVVADHYTPNDANTLPTGEIAEISGTDLDLREDGLLADLLDRVGGLDHNFVLREELGLEQPAAILSHPPSGRRLEVYTTTPGLQLYSADYLNGIIGKNGCSYRNQSAICLETQNFPDAVNQPNFPAAILRPEEEYQQTTIFRIIGAHGNSC